MHIEVWQGTNRVSETTGRVVAQRWHWHFKNRGRIVADAEAFPSKGNAIRAAKAVVRGVVNLWPGTPVYFTQKPSPDGKRTILRWS